MSHAHDIQGTHDVPEAGGGMGRVSRRGLFGLVAAGVGAGAVAGAAGTLAFDPTSTPSSDRYPFYGAHQAGITTPAQDRLHCAAFDLTDTATRDDLVRLLQDWSAAAARLTQGQDVSEAGAVGGPRHCCHRMTRARPSAFPQVA